MFPQKLGREYPFTSNYLSIDYLPHGENQLHYVDEGEGDPILMLHGNPTWSYYYRNLINEFKTNHRVVVPDQIGSGASKRPKKWSYDLDGHITNVENLVEHLQLKNITLVVHDWGSALGFEWANRNRDRIAGIVYMESIVQPVSWKEWPDASASIFKGFRSSAGEEMILKKNLFVEAVLPGSVLRKLTEEEMEEYRRPFRVPEHRLPTLKWPREIPIDGEPEDVYDIVSGYADWLAVSGIPKLFIDADPGAILIGEQREFCRKWANQIEIKVSDSHFITEDSQ